MSDPLNLLLSRCKPLSAFVPGELSALVADAELQPFQPGQVVLRSPATPARDLLFLVAGSAEWRRSFFDRVAVAAGEGLALQPLDSLLAEEGGQVLAGALGCTVARFSRAAIETLLAQGAERACSVEMLAEPDSHEGMLISDGAVELDWMGRFLQSPLAHSLPPVTIQQLLACLHSTDVEQGETLVRRGDTGSDMFIVTRGVATVKTDAEGVFGGREILLMAGDYFGEEALVADTVRNATVVMESAGAVARLGRSTFDELIRPFLVRTTSAVPVGADLIDVRFPVEYRRSALDGARNLPISVLRAQLSVFDPYRTIAVSGRGGERAELAVFLLCQAGLDAWLLDEAASLDGPVAA